MHSFAIAAHNTRMLGLLTSDVFESFFDVTGVATDDHVHTGGLIDPFVVMGGVQAHPDLPGRGRRTASADGGDGP